MPNDESRFGGARWNRLAAEIKEMAMAHTRSLIADLLADGGVPPGNVPVASAQQEYTRLLALRAMGSPHFWDNPLAQRRLAELEGRFGPGAPTPLSPFP